MNYVILIAILLNGCQSGAQSIGHPIRQPIGQVLGPEQQARVELKMYAEEFNQEFGIVKSGVRFMLVADDTIPDYQALCKLRAKVIYVAIDNYMSLTDTHKRNLVFHEKLHCEFQLMHYDATFKGGTPKSIMYTWNHFFKEQELKDLWAYYIKQAHEMVNDPKFKYKLD